MSQAFHTLHYYMKTQHARFNGQTSQKLNLGDEARKQKNEYITTTVYCVLVFFTLYSCSLIFI